MKYELLGKYTGNLIETILYNRKIFDVEKILKPTNENDTDVLKLPNIDIGVKTYIKNLPKKILFLVDSDVDGFASAATIYKYTKFANPFANTDFYVHPDKAHGITPKFINYIQNNKPDLVIITDGGTNDIEKREEIVAMGCDLIIIDHHAEVFYTDKGGVLINNNATFPKNDINPNLTGAGMTYLFCKAVEKTLNTGKLEQLLDLATLGLIGDSASLIDNEVRKICFDGINNINSNLLKTFCQEKGKDVDNLTFKDLSWGGIIPLINSVVRVGEVDQRVLVFKALADIDSDYSEIVSKRKLNKETRKYEMIDFNFNIYQLAIDAGEKCKNKQNSSLNPQLKTCETQFNPKAGVQIFITEKDDRGLTGLLANKLKSLWEQPTLVLWYDEEKELYNGSLRGYEKVLPDFNKWCLDTELFEFVQGHPNAAGVAIKAKNLQALKELTEQVTPQEIVHKIDILYQNEVNVNHIFELNNNKYIFGNGIDDPLFMIKNAKIPAYGITWSKSTLRLKVGEVTYIKFGVSEDEYNELKSKTKDFGLFDLVGRFEVNEWNGRQFPQVVLNDFELLNNATEQQNSIFDSTPTIDYGIFS